MSIIQTIRDKGAKVSVVLIALALVGFILTDYFSGRGGGAVGTCAWIIPGARVSTKAKTCGRTMRSHHT